MLNPHVPMQNSHVRMQGVGDLYTDPQIHTLDSQGYGDGNLVRASGYSTWL